MNNYAEGSNLQLWDSNQSYAKIPPLSIPSQQRRPKRGSFEFDRYDDSFNMLWPSWDVFIVWKKHVEETDTIQWAISTRDKGTLYKESIRYVCNRTQTGGDRNYQKKYPDRLRKIGTRKVRTSLVANRLY